MLELPVLGAVFVSFFVTLEDVEEVLPEDALFEEELLDEVLLEDELLEEVEFEAAAA